MTGRAATVWHRWLAAGLFALVFLYRFNALGGSLGGFDDDHFINLTRASQVLAGEWPLRDFADASLQGAWPPLTYLASAGAQLAVGHTLLAEAVLTAGAIALAAVLTLLAGRSMGLPVLVAAAAATFSVLPSVKLYGYARPLVFAAGSLLLFRYIDRSSWRRLLAMAAAGSAAFLIRHDYAVYMGAGAVVGLISHHVATPRVAVSRAVAYSGAAVLLLLPTLLIVHQIVGLDAYLASADALIADERARTDAAWPLFEGADVTALPNAIAFLYYLFLFLPCVAALTAIVRARRVGADDSLAKVLSLSAVAALGNYLLLRNNLEGRLADAAVPASLLGAWLLVSAWRAMRRARGGALRAASAAACAAALLAAGAAAVAAGEVGSVSSELSSTRFRGGPMATLETTARVARELNAMPPRSWDTIPAGGAMMAAAYLSTCLRPQDRVVNTTYFTEFLVFGRRLPAAGQANFVRGFYASEADQRRALARLAAQSAPVALMDPSPLSDSFVDDFPIVGRFLFDHYEEAGVIPQRESGETYLRVFVRRDQAPVGTFADTGLPCFR